MNKYQKALDSLRTECKSTFIDKEGKRWYTTDKNKDERCNLLQELVDKETPMKPNEHDKCSRCHDYFDRQFEYCPNCGQHVD